MPAFHYRCMTQAGREQSGVIEAESPRLARQQLRDRGLLPVEIRITHAKTGTKSQLRVSQRQSVSSKELTLITRQFATLLSAGLPVEEVIAATAEQTEKSATRALLLSVHGKVREGHTLAAALRDFPEAFSNLYCSTIAAGEKSGHLDIVLQRLADYIEQQHEMRQKVFHALIYPAIMILVAVSITGFLLEFVVPKMIAVYSNTGEALPAMTQLLISISAGIKIYGVFVLIALGLGIFLLRREIRRNAKMRTRWHQLLLKIPVVGYVIRTVNTARFSRTFAILSSAGVPVVEAMTIAAALITSLPMQTAVSEAVKRVGEGANISLALKQTGYFPPVSIHMIASGEASGQLESMLDRAAKHQETEISRMSETLLALFEPAIILVMGAMVLFIVLAVLLPIFQMDQFTG